MARGTLLEGSDSHSPVSFFHAECSVSLLFIWLLWLQFGSGKLPKMLRDPSQWCLRGNNIWWHLPRLPVNSTFLEKQILSRIKEQQYLPALTPKMSSCRHIQRNTLALYLNLATYLFTLKIDPVFFTTGHCHPTLDIYSVCMCVADVVLCGWVCTREVERLTSFVVWHFPLIHWVIFNLNVTL